MYWAMWPQTTERLSKTLLKHFKQIKLNPDRQAVVLITRRLAAKKTAL